MCAVHHRAYDKHWCMSSKGSRILVNNQMATGAWVQDHLCLVLRLSDDPPTFTVQNKNRVLRALTRHSATASRKTCEKLQMFPLFLQNKRDYLGCLESKVVRQVDDSEHKVSATRKASRPSSTDTVLLILFAIVMCTPLIRMPCPNPRMVH